MIITYTNLKTGVVHIANVDDIHCDGVLDSCAALMKPNPVGLLRWQAMMAKRAAGLYDGAAQTTKGRRK